MRIKLKEQARLFNPNVALAEEVAKFEEAYLQQVAREFGRMQKIWAAEPPKNWCNEVLRPSGRYFSLTVLMSCQAG